MSSPDKRDQGTRPIAGLAGAANRRNAQQATPALKTEAPPPAPTGPTGPPEPTGPTTDLQRWAAGLGAAPRVTVPEPTAASSARKTTRPNARPTKDGMPAVGGPSSHASAASAPPGRYLVESALGRGGVGEVDLVVDRDLQRKVAKKRLREEYRGEPLLIQAFLEEAMIAGALEHPGIVPVHDIGHSPSEGPWYTMKRLTGEPLANLLSRLRGAHPETMRQWPLARLVEVFVQALRAIAHAHGRGVVHCDLKPGNILCGDLGEVVVVDWGLAKVLGEGGMYQARARLWSGSPGYMSPEQATSEDTSVLDTRADVWALGAILYELMTLVVPQALSDGSVPEPATDGSYAAIVPVRQRSAFGPYRREVPTELAVVVDRALAHDPAERYYDVREMLAAVEGWLQGTRERERREARVLAAAQAVDQILVSGTTELHKLASATDQLVDALHDGPDRPELTWRGSSLYWVVFRTLHSSAEAADGSMREQATALLDRLASLVVPAPPSPPDGAGQDIEPWLDALEEVADAAPRVRSLANRLRALHATPLFAALSGHELVPVASAVEVKKIAAGQALFAEGEAGDALWVLVQGTVDVAARGKHLNTMHAPACFGEIALVERSTRTATVTAESDVLALTLTAARFDELVRRHGAIALGVMRLLAERLRAATAREVSS